MAASRLVVDSALARLGRLDKVIAAACPAASRKAARDCIAAGAVSVNGRATRKQSALVPPRAVLSLRPGHGLELQRPQLVVPPRAVRMNRHFLCVDKPAGLLSQPADSVQAPDGAVGDGGPGQVLLPHSLLDQVETWLALEKGKPQACHMLHRVDRLASGVVVFVRTRGLLPALQRAMEDGMLQRVYRVVVHGQVPFDVKRVRMPIRKDTASSAGWRFTTHPAGRPARTTVAVVARGADYTVLDCEAHTGRTHQVRVHLAALGHPVIGDTLYGASPMWEPSSWSAGQRGRLAEAQAADHAPWPTPEGTVALGGEPGAAAPATLPPWLAAGRPRVMLHGRLVRLRRRARNVKLRAEAPLPAALAMLEAEAAERCDAWMQAIDTETTEGGDMEDAGTGDEDEEDDGVGVVARRRHSVGDAQRADGAARASLDDLIPGLRAPPQEDAPAPPEPLPRVSHGPAMAAEGDAGQASLLRFVPEALRHDGALGRVDGRVVAVRATTGRWAPLAHSDEEDGYPVDDAHSGGDDDVVNSDESDGGDLDGWSAAEPVEPAGAWVPGEGSDGEDAPLPLRRPPRRVRQDDAVERFERALRAQRERR